MNKKLKTVIKRFFQGLLLVIFFFLVLVGSLVLCWVVRPNTAQVNDRLDFIIWDAISNSRHNANTDMCYWNGSYYFIYANQPGNQGSTTTFLSVNKGPTLHNLTQITTLNVPGEDIRDPKFAVIKNQLFIYYLKNRGFIADPYTTAFVNSSDGLHFSTARDVSGLEGWCFWRPKTNDNITWYDTAYSATQSEIILLSTTDGFTWTKVSSVSNASGSSEPELTFLADKRMLVSIRVEAQMDTIIGSVNAGTGLAIAAPPYKTWNYTLDRLTKLDGPNLFNINDSLNNPHYFALGRFQPDVDSVFTASGSVFSRKRTSLFEFVNLSTRPTLKYISDLPSSGDTSYGGVIIQGDRLYMCYYSSDPTKDYGWLLGMILPSDIYMVNMSIASLFDAAAHPLTPPFTLPWDNYIVVAANAGFISLVLFWLVRKHSKKRNSVDLE